VVRKQGTFAMNVHGFMSRSLPAILVGSVVALCSCRRSESPKEPIAPPANAIDPGIAPVRDAPPLITVGHVGHDHQIALYVAALEADRFRNDYGICLAEKKSREVYDLVQNGETLAELRLIKVGGATAMPAAMQRGEIMVGFGGVAPVSFFIDKGADFKIICPLQTEGDMLVVRPDLPVTDWDSFVTYAKQSESPVRIGYKGPLAVAKLIFVRALDEVGLTHEAEDATVNVMVKLVNLQGGKNMVPSLAAGMVDGIVMNQPTVSVAAAKGVGQVIANLADLPPAGMWKDHPCCCVAAKTDTIAQHRDAIVALLKLMHLSTAFINADKLRAAGAAARWTKVPVEVEKDSIPSVTYVSEFSESWKCGMTTWGQIMHDIGKFSGDLQGKQGQEFLNLTCDFTLSQEAERDLRARGLLD